MIRAALAISILVASSTSAVADKAAADVFVAEATAADAAGDFKKAAEKFTAAFKEDPSRPQLFCNVGISYYKADDLPRAHLLLNRCLERTALETTFVQTVRTALTAIETTMRAGNYTRVTINVQPAATTLQITELGGDETSFTGTRTLWFSFGTFHLTAHAEGFVNAGIEIVTDKAEPKEVTIKLERPADKVPPPPPKHVVQARPSPALPIVASGVTVAAGILLFIAHGKAKDIEDVAPFALSREAFDDDKSEVKKWNSVIGASATVVVIGAGVSTYLWIRFASHKEPALEVSPTPTGATVSYRGRF